MAIFDPPAAGAPPVIKSSWSANLYYPDSLGDLYGRVTELLGFAAKADEHKVQWLSTADDGAAYLPLFEEILGNSEWPAINRSYFDADRLSQGGFSEKFYRHVGLGDGEDIPQKLKAPLAAGLQRAVERAVLRMAGPSNKLCIAGGLALNALLISSLEASKEVFVQPAAGNTGTALGAVLLRLEQRMRSKQARLVERSMPRPLLFKRRNQEGNRKLQAPLPLPADHR